jgi:hypothetical protein
MGRQYPGQAGRTTRPSHFERWAVRPIDDVRDKGDDVVDVSVALIALAALIAWLFAVVLFIGLARSADEGDALLRRSLERERRSLELERRPQPRRQVA